MHPETKYARSGDLHIAYQVVGDGPIDLVFVPGNVSHLDLMWEEPAFARFRRRLTHFARTITFDKRGTGLSDRSASIATLEDRMDDVRAVMDAAGSERAAIFGVSEGGPMSMLFAATYPERTVALILSGALASIRGDDDYPWRPRWTDEEFESRLQSLEADPSAGLAVLEGGAPSVAGDPAVQEWFLRFQSAAASPGARLALLKMNSRIDVRPILPAIHVPTLVIQVSGDRWTHVEEGRYIAARIPEARYVELAGTDHIFMWENGDRVAAEAEEFLTGVRQGPDPDRVLATILFTDIVGSTERAAAIGDKRWRELLQKHDDVVRRTIARFRGREIHKAGDGFLVIVDGPARGIHAARAIIDGVRPLGIEVRTGLHTGEIELTANDEVEGIAVHIGARVSSLAGPGEVLVSRTIRDLVSGSGIRFEDRGVHALKGVPDEWQLYLVTGTER